jgi:hypothetical protein
MVTSPLALVLVLAARGATEPVVSEGEDHMQIVVLRCLYDVIEANESVLPLVDLDRAVLVEDLEPYAIIRNFGNVVESPSRSFSYSCCCATFGSDQPTTLVQP